MYVVTKLARLIIASASIPSKYRGEGYFNIGFPSKLNSSLINRYATSRGISLSGISTPGISCTANRLP